MVAVASPRRVTNLDDTVGGRQLAPVSGLEDDRPRLASGLRGRVGRGRQDGEVDELDVENQVALRHPHSASFAAAHLRDDLAEAARQLADDDARRLVAEIDSRTTDGLPRHGADAYHAISGRICVPDGDADKTPELDIRQKIRIKPCAVSKRS